MVQLVECLLKRRLVFVEELLEILVLQHFPLGLADVQISGGAQLRCLAAGRVLPVSRCLQSRQLKFSLSQGILKLLVHRCLDIEFGNSVLFFVRKVGIGDICLHLEDFVLFLIETQKDRLDVAQVLFVFSVWIEVVQL